MEEVFFEEAINIDWAYVTKLRNTNKQCIGNVSRVFANNLSMVKSLIELIPAILAIAMRYGRNELLTTQEMTGGRSLFTEEEQKNASNMDAFYALLESITTAEEEHLNSSSLDKKIEAARSMHNTRYILQRYTGPVFESGVRALLRATIKDTWTAIEVMSSDLLKTVMDTFPQCFRKIKWDENEPKFGSRRGIKSAYEKAFPVDYDTIRSALYSDGIDAVALLRNVLVHNSGLADFEFIEGVKGNPLLAPLQNHAEKQIVKIDGGIIKTVVEPAMKAGCDLIMAVDTWITMAVPNPPTKV